MRKRLTLEEIKIRSFALNSNIEILGEFDKETGITKKRINRYVYCRCNIDGYEWTPRVSGLLDPNYGCPKCGGVAKLTLTEIKEKLSILNPMIEIISDTYINNVSGLKCKCLVKSCNHEWEACSSSLLYNETGCPKCYLENNKGETSQNWKGGVTSLHKYLRGCITQWKQDSFKKYNYKCDITKSSKNLNIHHFHNFSSILNETFIILNLPIKEDVGMYNKSELELIVTKFLELHNSLLGICITSDEHQLFHSIYGRKNNTIEQYKEFKNNRLKQLNNIAS